MFHLFSKQLCLWPNSELNSTQYHQCKLIATSHITITTTE